MPDNDVELGNAIRKISEKLAEEELSRISVPEQSTESLRREVVGRLEKDLMREFEESAKKLREEIRSDLDSYVKKERKEELARAKAEQVTFIRFNRNFRFQHMVLFSSVIFLILTGMPMKFNEWGISVSIVDMLGGGEMGVSRLRTIHRIAAGALIFFFAYHMIYNLFFKEGRRDFWLMLPRPRDLFDVIQMVKYFLGMSKDKPRFDRFSYIEKFDYWAVYWGCVVMIFSGAILWFNEIVGIYFPKWSFDLAKIVHSDEALLATLALVVWHFYNVHFNPDRFPGSLVWWHGRLTEEEMKHEHPLEYERIIAEKAKE